MMRESSKLRTSPIAAMCLVAALGLLYTFTSQDVKRRSAKSLNNEAVDLLETEDPLEALDLLLRAAGLDPDCAEVHFNLAQAYSMLRGEGMAMLGVDPPNLYRAILSEAKTAASLSPAEMDVALYCARLHFAAEDYGAEPDWESAADAWTRCLALHKARLNGKEPNPAQRFAMASVLHALATIAIRRDRLDEVRLYYESAMAMLPENFHPNNWERIEAAIGLSGKTDTAFDATPTNDFGSP